MVSAEPTLYPDQQVVVDKIRAAYAAGHRRVLLQASTAWGKTIGFSYIASRMAERGKRVLICMHREELKEQIVNSLAAFNVHCGSIGGKVSGGYGLTVSVGKVLSVVNRLGKFPVPDLLIIDEAHRAVGPSYMKLQAALGCKTLLVTATPQRLDGRGMGEVADVMIKALPMRELIRMGRLADYNLFSLPQYADLSNLRLRGGDYTTESASSLMNRNEVFGNVVGHYKSLTPGKQFICFTPGVEMAAIMSERFNAAGFSCANIDGTTKDSDRLRITNGMRDGSLTGVTSCDLLNEGFDVPNASVAMCMRKTASIVVALQQPGRVLRAKANGEKAWILDFAGNYVDPALGGFGPPDTARAWSLEGIAKADQKKVEKGFSCRICGQCQLQYSATESACPYCGVSAEKKSRLIEEVDGLLVEITEEMRRASEIAKMRYEDRLSSAQTVEDFKRIQEACGYKFGWLKNRIMERFKVDEYHALIMLGYSSRQAYGMTRHRAA